MQIRLLLALLATIGCAFSPPTHAAEMSIPELGVHFGSLPAGVPDPEVKARIDGYTATLHIGTANLRIDRMEETVPSDSDIRNAGFRATQETGFDEHHFSNTGHPTTINAHDAWITNVSERTRESTLYLSRAYVVVDGHLYRFMAAGWWKSDTPPPDFVAAVKAYSEITFGPVDRSATSGGRPPSGLVKMPYFFPSSRNYYPETARRGGETGIVDLEFSIDGKGRARDVQEIYAAHDLGASARSLLADTRFHVAFGWEDKGYQKLRFTFEVHYGLTGRGMRCEQLPTRVPEALLVLICGSAP